MSPHYLCCLAKDMRLPCMHWEPRGLANSDKALCQLAPLCAGNTASTHDWAVVTARIASQDWVLTLRRCLCPGRQLSAPHSHACQHQCLVAAQTLHVAGGTFAAAGPPAAHGTQADARINQSATTSGRCLDQAVTARCPPRAGTFANTSAASPFAAAWAGAPDAVIYATANGSRVGALLALTQPAFDAAASKLTFAVRLVPAEAAALALAGGASARVRCYQCKTRTLVHVMGVSGPLRLFRLGVVPAAGLSA